MLLCKAPNETGSSANSSVRLLTDGSKPVEVAHNNIMISICVRMGFPLKILALQGGPVDGGARNRWSQFG